MKKILLLFILTAFGFSGNHSGEKKENSSFKEIPKSDVYMQGFYWNSPPGGIWYDSLASLAPRLASAGFSGIWFPPPEKGAGGGMSMGYDPYDHYDFGNYNQKGTRETRFGSKEELVNAINSFHNVGIQVFADAVLRHMMGGEKQAAYECIPYNNGYPIVPDSAFLVFNYPNGSGRFKKSPADFYPNNKDCFVDPLFVQTDPIFRFGEWLDHNKKEVRDSLIVWGKYLKNEIGFDGFRLDAVKSIDPAFMAEWLKNTNGNDYAVAEDWASTQEIGDWLNTCQNINGGNVAMFDFPLRFTLKDMCNNTGGSFDMNNLDNAGLVNSGFSGYDVSTFVENHDFDRTGWDGTTDNGNDPILSDKDLAYAYIIFSEGRPCVFFKDYFDYGLSGKIDSLIWIRQKYLGGGTTNRNELNAYYIGQNGSTDQTELSKDIYVAKRNGYGKQPGGYLVINDNPDQWIDIWVNTDEPVGTVYKDFTNNDANKIVTTPDHSGGKNRVKLWAPPRGYTIYVADTVSVMNNPPVLQNIPDQIAYTNSVFNYSINVKDANDDSLIFSLKNNPVWLKIDNKGILNGNPAFADTGSINVIVNVNDNFSETAADTFKITVYLNYAPKIEKVDDQKVAATERIKFQLIAADEDGDSLKYGFNRSPAWLNIGKTSGLVSATPSLSDTGVYKINVFVSDGKGAFDSTSFNLQVSENSDSIVATYGKPVIDGNISVGPNDWLDEWQLTADSDSDSYWNPGTVIDNEIFGLFATWDADSLYVGVDYKINDNYNTLITYFSLGLPGGVVNFNSDENYNGDYAKNFVFPEDEAINFFTAAYFLNKPEMFKVDSSTSEIISKKINSKRGKNAKGSEVAVSWNDLYGLGAGVIPKNASIKLVAIVAGGLNYGGADSAPDNTGIKGDAGPDSINNLAEIKPDKDGNGIPDPTVFITEAALNNQKVPAEYKLYQNYPNPFNPTTTISFNLPIRSIVELKIFDVLGRLVEVLADKEMTAGKHSLRFDGSGLASGVYIYTLKSGNFNAAGKLILLK